MYNLTKIFLAIAIIALLLGLIYIQLEIQNIQSNIQPKEMNPTSTPNITPSPSPTPYVPPASVISDLNYSISLSSDQRTDIVLVNGTVTNNSTNTAYNVGLLVTAYSTSSYYPYVYNLGAIVPLVSGNYYDDRGITRSANSTAVGNLTGLSPYQTVKVSITVYPTDSKSLHDPQVRPVWSNMP
jgi:hypothetical protein